MKQIYKDKIININNNSFDNKFLFQYLDNLSTSQEVEVFYLAEMLKKCKNEELYNNLGEKYAMYSEVYSPKDELKIFEELFEYALSNNKKIHIVGITLKEELQILEEYYIESGYLREDMNCFVTDFRKALVTVSVHIENLMWRGSDYKANGKNIFFIPPIRESGQNKAIFKGINRGSISGVSLKNFGEKEKHFLESVIKEEKILPITLAKVLKYNLEEIWFTGKDKKVVVSY